MQELHIEPFLHPAQENETHVAYADFIADVKAFRWRGYMRKCDRLVFHCKSFHHFPKRFLTLAICRLFSKRECVIENENGEELRVGIRVLIGALGELITDKRTCKKFLAKTSAHIEELENAVYDPKVSREGVAYYIRNDYVMQFQAGGSVGHIAGIANNMRTLCDGLMFVTSDYIPTVDDGITQHIIEDYDDLRYTNVRDVTSLYYNIPAMDYLNRLAKKKKPAFVYHRLAINEYSAIEFSIRHNIPFILENNGSEVWIREHWAESRKADTVALSIRIEKLCFAKASLIVCVSEPLRQQLLEMGVDSGKIIVVPNGVNPEKYRPDLDGSKVRKEYGIGNDEVVVGFIGTFGAWHGTDFLAEAAVEILKKRGVKMRFLFIGDGLLMPRVRQIVADGKAENDCIFTGMVPQNEGMDYMAACDILVSPQIPNADGSPFFGSPTKLFEYMAMGKGIIVSDMDQMGEICEDGVTALMPKPGDRKELADAIVRLSQDEQLRRELGRNARKEVCEKYTWETQVRKIMEEFEARCRTA